MSASEILNALPETRALIEWAHVLHGADVSATVKVDETRGPWVRVSWDQGDDSEGGGAYYRVLLTSDEAEDPERKVCALHRADRDLAAVLVHHLVIPLIREG